MPRSRRRIISGQPYELILRVSGKLPFIPLCFIKLLIESAIARAQRDIKITICHFIWMGNHVHMILIPQDPQQCVNFYQELQKKITDYFKRLTGSRKLNLWDGSPVLSQILDIEKVVEKIAYLYANPATANLVERIEDYPGLSTYREFIEAANNVDAKVERTIPYIKQTSISRLRSLRVTHQEDKSYYEDLIENANGMHSLAIHPNAWMRAFAIKTDTEVAKYNLDVLNAIKRREEEARIKRREDGKKVVSVSDLRQFFILKKCVSKKRERRILFHASTKELRLSFMAGYRHFVDQCRRCFELLKQGIQPEWPPGAFRPAAPPIASALI